MPIALGVIAVPLHVAPPRHRRGRGSRQQIGQTRIGAAQPLKPPHTPHGPIRWRRSPLNRAHHVVDTCSVVTRSLRPAPPTVASNCHSVQRESRDDLAWRLVNLTSGGGTSHTGPPRYAHRSLRWARRLERIGDLAPDHDVRGSIGSTTIRPASPRRSHDAVDRRAGRHRGAETVRRAMGHTCAAPGLAPTGRCAAIANLRSYSLLRVLSEPVSRFRDICVPNPHLRSGGTDRASLHMSPEAPIGASRHMCAVGPSTGTASLARRKDARADEWDGLESR